MTQPIITRLSKLDAPDDAERKMLDQIWLAKFIQAKHKRIADLDALLRAKEASKL